MSEQIKLCIIGGGPLGIGLGRELNEGNIDYDLYETESDFGGVWNSTANCGRVYPSLHLISPKFNTQVPDYPMPDYYPVYPNHKMMLNYLRSYAKNFDVYKHAIFNTSVMKLELIDDNWLVTLSNGTQKYYSFVAVCNGAQRLPHYPNPPYNGYFSGQKMHSMEYKSPDQIRNKRVLIIGAGNSGCDIAVDALHHSTSVYHSTRRGYHYYPKFINGKPTPQWMLQLGNKFKNKKETMAYVQQVFKLAGFDGTDYGLKLPDHPIDGAHPIMNSQILYHIGHGDIIAKDDVVYLDNYTVHFSDDSNIEVDVIIYATGYDHNFPFIDSTLLDWKAGILDLFIHITPRKLNNIFFFGFVNAAAGLGDGLRLQGQFIRSYIKAFTNKSSGYFKFIQAKQEDDPDLGQDYFLDSRRHLWEVDFWKFIQCARKYRDMLDER